jgi:hypothetical protein
VKLVYIAGAYSGATLVEVDRNVEEARNVALMLAERRIPFLCTILQTAHFDTLLREHDPGYSHWINVSFGSPQALRRDFPHVELEGVQGRKSRTGGRDLVRDAGV